ncbi:MAG: GNAT family N-acetyltransferase [Phycisphaerales bacterium]|nr:GNAT family N-acetyltransferase [Phycisphaerales bacterium]
MIRSATPADIPAILALIRELAAYEKLTHACVATEELLTQHLFGSDRAAEALVAEITTPVEVPCVIGYAIFFKTFSTFLARPGFYLEDIYVQPKYRNQGHGKAMLQHLAQLTLARNYGRLEWTCLDWNTPSLAFYQSIGADNLKQWQLHRLTGETLKKFASPTSPSHRDANAANPL